MTQSSESQPIQFDRDIKPLFREKDRNAMMGSFDLWSYGDVKKNAGAILDAIGGGSMPCDGAWPPDRVDMLRRWIAAGTPP
jgi:hypothetical protein